jgi:manganese transport protein
MVALLVLSSRRDIMGSFVSRRSTLALAIIAAAVVLALNLVLLLQTAGMPVSFLGTN